MSDQQYGQQPNNPASRAIMTRRPANMFNNRMDNNRDTMIRRRVSIISNKPPIASKASIGSSRQQVNRSISKQKHQVMQR